LSSECVVCAGIVIEPVQRCPTSCDAGETKGYGVGLRDGCIPLRFQGGVAAPLIKRSRSLAAPTGWLVNSNKIRSATQIFIRRLRGLLLTTPSAPLRNGTFY